MRGSAHLRSMWFLFFLVLYGVWFPLDVHAATITFSEPSASTFVSQDQELSIQVRLSIHASDGTPYYLRGVFSKDGTHNYCGYTWNGTDWFSGPYSSNEGWKNFLLVTIASDSAETILKAKLDREKKECQENGTYQFRVQRFIATSGSGTFDGQEPLVISVSLPTLTPTSLPTSSPIPIPSLTVTPKSTITQKSKPIESDSTSAPSKSTSPLSKIPPSVTPTPTPVTESVALAISPTQLVEEKAYEDNGTVRTEVLGIETENQSRYAPYFFLLTGICFLIAGVFVGYQKFRKNDDSSSLL